MKNETHVLAGRNALVIADEAFHLLRFAPARLWASYLAGAVPFTLGFLHFWTDMSRSAFAADYCLPAALGLALLFVWMKAWHAVFMNGLRHHLMGTTGAPWTLYRVFRLVTVQATAQVLGLVLMPVAFIVMLPFPALSVFIEQVSADADGNDASLRDILRRAWDQSTSAAWHTGILIWLFSPWLFGAMLTVIFGTSWLLLSTSPDLYLAMQGLWFVVGLALLFLFGSPMAPVGCIIAGSIAIFVALLPELAYTVTGTPSAFTLSGANGILNSTFLMVVGALTCIALDMIFKSAVLLRQFYIGARSSGADLLVDISAATSARETAKLRPAAKGGPA